MSKAPIVTVKQGRLQGKVVNSPSGKGYFAFQGIPYAKPPLGSLRFKDPQPHEPWEGIRDASTEGNVAPQICFIFGEPYKGDENCLFLNIYSPNLDGSLLPVMFYIHGGSFVLGSGNTDMCGPDYLVEKDVVVVTINYRLGPLGFLCLNTPEVPGNAGLKDVIMALRWVNENVHNFGGNPGNLTIFGQSVGGAATSLLTACPIARNLFSRAIVQSGTALLLDNFCQKDPIDNARKLAKSLGCESGNVDEILKFLSATPAKQLIETNLGISDIIKPRVEDIHIPFTVVVEKEFPGIEAALTEPVLNFFTSGRIAQVPIMVGSTTLEYGFLQKSDDLQSFIPNQLNIEKDSEISHAIAAEIKKLYFKGGSEVIENAQLLSDTVMNVDIHRYIQYLLQSSNIPIYFYKFDYVGTLNIANEFCSGGIKDRPIHLDELGYLFKNDFQKDVEPTPQDLKVRERIVRLWTNFAKTGNPTPDVNHYINVTWPPATKDNESYLLISRELYVGSNYDKEKMDFWDELYSKYYKIWEQPEHNAVDTRKELIIIETSTNVSSSEKRVVETVQVVESNRVLESNKGIKTPEAGETALEVVETKKGPEEAKKPEQKVDGDIENGNSNDRKVTTSNEIKTVQSTDGVPKDVIRANDPLEGDFPKKIGVNKFVNFYESLGGKK